MGERGWGYEKVHIISLALSFLSCLATVVDIMLNEVFLNVFEK